MLKKNQCSIIMYHYVRPLKGSKFSELKALEISSFESQLDFLTKHYIFVTPTQVIDAIYNNKSLPKNSVLLSFDDGYKDHFKYVYPILKKRGIIGLFFPPTAAVYENKILDVNRLHFTLASTDINKLIYEMEQILLSLSKNKNSKNIDYYRRVYWRKGIYDSAPVNYIKKLLQHVVPEKSRNNITKNLFTKFVTKDEISFSKELYLDSSELKEMKDGGMEIGSHGHNHYWLEHEDIEVQKCDIEKSLYFLRQDDLLSDKFWFSYPYGSFSLSTQNILKNLGCGASVCYKQKIAECNSKDSLALNRFDTNDIPTC